MTKEKVSKLGDAHIAWLSALEFYKNDINFLKGRLTEIAGKNTGRDVAGDMEHFENQMNLQAENIDQLHHDINANLARSAAQVLEKNADFIDSELIRTHDLQKEQFAALEKAINELRQNFNQFAAKWM